MRLFGISHAMGRRSVPRTPASLMAMLSTGDRESRAALIDISRTGARLGGKILPAEGEQLVFNAEGVQAHADVIWSEAEVCAIEFNTPIAAAEVQRLRSLAALD